MELSVLLLLAACADARISDSETALSVEPAELVFARTWVGHPSELPLELVNLGRAPQGILVTVEGPFQLSTHPTELSGAARQTLQVRFVPEAAGDFDGAIGIEHEGGTLRVLLRGSAEVPPTCGDSECHQGVFDPSEGACRQVPLRNGTACINPCLESPVCVQGLCVGAAKACDDGNVCTVDSCDPEKGCVNADSTAQCPQPSNPCKVPVCNPESGCGEANAADYTPCGPVSCETANVCLGGTCVAFDPPDGFPCASASPCQGPGTCKARKCERPPPGPLATSWAWAPAERHNQAEIVLADADGNLYLVVWPAPAQVSCEQLYAGAQEEIDRCIADRTSNRRAVVSLTSQGGVRWTWETNGAWTPVFVDHGRVWVRGKSETVVLNAANGAVVATIPETHDTFHVGDRLMIAVKSAFTPSTEVFLTAYDVRSGAQLWSKSVLQGGTYTSAGVLVLENDRVLVVLQDASEVSLVLFLDAAGSELSRLKGGMISPASLPTPRFPIFFGRGSTLSGFDAQNLSFEWQLDYLAGARGRLGPMVGDDERLYFTVARESVDPSAYLRSLDARRLADGSRDWAQSLSLASPVTTITNDQIWLTSRSTLFVQQENRPTRVLAELRTTDGEPLYECTISATEFVFGIGDQRIYVNVDGTVKALAAPNLGLAKRGWVTRYGNPGRSNRPW